MALVVRCSIFFTLFFGLMNIVSSCKERKTNSESWVELKTTFRQNNLQPRTSIEAEENKWIKILDKTKRFAGFRYYPPMEIPDKVLIYDGKGQVVGFQSCISATDFALKNFTLNPFYIKDVIGGKEVYLATVYFKDPRSLTKKKSTEELYLQKGEDWHSDKNLLRVPRKYSEVKANQGKWNLDQYVPGMGHHVSIRVNMTANDCAMNPPIQALYALNKDKECVNTGFLVFHFTSSSGTGWEKPNSNIMKLLFPHILPCAFPLMDKGGASSMHVFLGGSTSRCLKN